MILISDPSGVEGREKVGLYDNIESVSPSLWFKNMNHHYKCFQFTIEWVKLGFLVNKYIGSNPKTCFNSFLKLNNRTLKWKRTFTQ